MPSMESDYLRTANKSSYDLDQSMRIVGINPGETPLKSVGFSFHSDRRKLYRKSIAAKTDKNPETRNIIITQSATLLAAFLRLFA